MERGFILIVFWIFHYFLTVSGNTEGGAIAATVGGAIATSTGCVIVVAILLGSLYFFLFVWWPTWRKTRHQDAFDIPAEEAPEVHLRQLKRFSHKELLVATNNFSHKNVLGTGGSRKFYKGCLADGSLVAVKRLKDELNQGGDLQFQNEVEMISRAVHCNLVRLKGFCIIPKERMLVYPYMANGSLASYLRERKESQPPLDWPTRKRIALGSAKGLAYLHEYCDPKILHRDIKAANILLDNNFNAIVGDFGISKLMNYKDTHVTTGIRGTIGYIAPEYFSTGKCSEKTDVFGYGIMLLELITGYLVLDFAQLASNNDVLFLDWVKKLLKVQRYKMLVDADLEENYTKEKAEELIRIALLCTQSSPGERPRMSEVVRLLEGENLVDKWETLIAEEVLPNALYYGHLPNRPYVVDSTSNHSPDELSGPR